MLFPFQNHIETCPSIIVSEPSNSVMSMSSGSGNTSTVTVYSDNHFPDMFVHRLNSLMQVHGKTYSDLLELVRPQVYQSQEPQFCPPPVSHPVSMMNGQHHHQQHQHQSAYPMFQEVESLRHRDNFYSEYL